MECPNCKKQLADNAKSCPECGFDFTAKKKSPLIGCLSVIGGIFVVLCAIGIMLGTSEDAVNNQMQEISDKVAQDSVQEYEIAKRQGDKMQACVQAGMVSAAFLQAHDEINYNKWKAVEKADCKAAGMPQY